MQLILIYRSLVHRSIKGLFIPHLHANLKLITNILQVESIIAGRETLSYGKEERSYTETIKSIMKSLLFYSLYKIVHLVQVAAQVSSNHEGVQNGCKTPGLQSTWAGQKGIGHDFFH